MTREIPLTQGQVALVDDVDFDAVMAAGPWCAHWRTNGRVYHAIRNVKSDTTRTGKASQRLHTFLTGYAQTDHINRNPLDNRRDNLRPATHTENMRNRTKKPDCISQYKGVSRRLYRGVWKGMYRARINVNGKDIYLGTFSTEEDAARAYDAAARLYFGEFANCNFPVI